MKKNIKKIIIYIIIMIILLISIIYMYLFHKNTNLSKKEKIVSLININDYSQKKINTYLDDIKKLNKQKEKEYSLIVISSKKITNGYGETKIINAPNNQYILIYDSNEKKENAKAKLKEKKYVLNIDENVKYELATNDTKSSSSEYNSWGIQKTGLDKLINNSLNKDLKEINVAIIDTGLDVNLFNKYYPNRIKEIHNIYDNDDTMYDNNGHGTHIAGTIAEGTTKNVKIISVKDSDHTTFDLINLIASVNWVVFNNKADIINLSCSTNIYNESLYQTIEAAKNNNIISVAAAGNFNTSEKSYPAAYDNTISIAAVDNNLEKASYSNYGNTITFTAPGTNIKSINGNYTQLSQLGEKVDDEHILSSGTSMSTPHAVAAIAMLKSYNKNLSLEETINLLKENSIDLGEDGWDPIYGYGFINFSNTNMCDGSNCDEYNIFKNSEENYYPKYDFGSDTYVSLYNYGNNTNLYDMEVKMYYSDDEYITKQLGDLEELEILNYDPYIEENQIISIKYKNITYEKQIKNYLTEGWLYDFHDETKTSIEIKGFASNIIYPKYIEIPETYNGYTIVSLAAEAFKDKNKIKKVKITDNIKYIEHSTFFNCNNLNYITLPKKLKKIGDFAFMGTTSLSSINIPNELEEIGSNAFTNSGLDYINLVPSIKTIGFAPFSSSKISEVVIEDGISEISANTFQEMPKLKKITIPKSVTKIESETFNGDYNIIEIAIDNNNNIYESEKGSTTIVDKTNNKLIYAGNNSILPKKLTEIHPYSLHCNTIYKIPNTITKLKNNAIQDCNYVLLPNNINTIESPNAFNNSSSYNEYFVYEGSYSHNYLKDNNINYYIYESEKPVIEKNRHVYNAFEKVLLDDINVYIEYDGIKPLTHSVNTIYSQNYTVTYKNNKSSFSYGDEYYTITFESKLGTKFNEKVYVTVNKITPKYEIPTNIEGKIGDKLSKINLPKGFSWENENEIIKLDSNLYKARYTPEDNINYETVNNIDIEVIGLSNTINPDITINDKIYDGTLKINHNNISIEGIPNNKYSIESAILNNSDVGVATASITIKLDEEIADNYKFDDGSIEKEFNVDINILPLKLKKVTLENKKYIYNGKEQVASLVNYIEDKMNIENNIRTEAGKQYITISLKNKNYTWDDDTNNDLKLPFVIEKAKPQIEYNISPLFNKYDGTEKKITIDIISPESAVIKFMDTEGNYTLDTSPVYKEIGDYIIKYKISLDNNYEEIFEEKTLSIREETIIYTANNYTGIYDEKEHTINLNINSDNYSIKYSTDNENFTLDDIPYFKNIGEHTIYFKISKDGINDIIDSRKVIIYGIKNIDPSINIKNDIITTNESTITNLLNKIKIHSISTEIIHLDNNENKIERNEIISGDYLVIKINNNYSFKYKILNSNSNTTKKDDTLVVEVGDTNNNNNKLYIIISIILIISGLITIYIVSYKKQKKKYNS